MLRSFRKLKRIIEWLPILWRDEDWDYQFLVKIIQFKLRRMADCIDRNEIISDHKKARQMRIVAGHLDRFQAHSYWDSNPYQGWHIGYTKEGKFKRKFNPDYIFPYAQDRQIHDLEEWHWNEAWRKIAKYGMGWWD
jgi:hypothetical protein